MLLFNYFKCCVTNFLMRLINFFYCSSWIDDCDKMVDRQKALLMVLIALLIYPNDIFGKSLAKKDLMKHFYFTIHLNMLNVINISNNSISWRIFWQILKIKCTIFVKILLEILSMVRYKHSDDGHGSYLIWNNHISIDKYEI